MTADAIDYRLSHRPTEDGDMLHDLGVQSVPPDVYDHPEWYGHGDSLPMCAAVIRKVRGCPDATVLIYRAVPEGVSVLNTGDWVTIAESYARQHAMVSEDPVDDWPVISARVPASTVRYSGSDILEWGYWGPPVQAS